MKQRLFAAFTLFAICVVMMAVPVKPGITKTLRLSDGTEIKALLVGDEHGHFWRGEDGKAYLIGDDEVCREIDETVIIEKAQQRRAKTNAQFSRRLARRTFGQPTHYTGQKKALIVLVNFSDKKFKSAHDNALFQRIANEENFNEDPFVGSMADYFKAQSRGIFELDFDVVGPVTVSKTSSYYGSNDSEGYDKHPGEMVVEAVNLAKNEVTDWKQYDWDDDGYVDQVYLVYAGKGEADTNQSSLIWPHAYTLTESAEYGDGSGPVTVATGLKVDTYACGNEIDGYTDDINGIGTMCHEFSHCLGYPDFYDIDYSGGQGMLSWSIMDSGSYNGGGFIPAGFTSYERWMAGWLDPIVLEDKDVTVENLKSLQNGGESYVIYNKGNSNEYFLIENRQQDGWDAGLPGKGLLIIHIDYNANIWANNAPNDTKSHQRVTVVPADGKFQSTTYQGQKYFTEEGQATDPFPYSSVTAFNRDFTAAETQARLAAKLYNKNTDGTYYIDSSVESIKQNGNGTVSFKFVAAYGQETPDPDPDPEPGPVVEGDGDYKKVDSSSQIVPGQEYVLVNEQYEKGNGDFSNKYLTAVDVTIDGNTVTGEELCPFLLGGNADGYSLAIGGQYLTTTSAKNMKLVNTEAKVWMITSTDDGYVVASEDYGTIQYNSASNANRFLNYTSKQKPAVLYVKTIATEIQNINATAKTGCIYTIDGRFVGTDLKQLKRGLYICDGKKLFVR